MKPKPICIFHSIDGHNHCDDGFGAAYAVWKCYADDYDYFPGVYQTDPPDVTGRDVVMVDFSYKRSVVEKMAETANHILIIDHHASACTDLAEYVVGWEAARAAKAGLKSPNPRQRIHAYFDMGQSGAMLAWQFFHPGAQPPDLIWHIQDRDLWKFELPGTKAISMALRSYPQDFYTWNRLMDNFYTPSGRVETDDEDLTKEGEAINRWYLLQINKMKENVIRQTIGGYDVPTVNAPIMFASDLAGDLSEGEPFAACYFDLPQGRVFSLRSREGGLDVSEIAKQYGGGGHRNSAGFKIDRRLLP